MERGDWFDLLNNPTATVTVEPQSVGATTFTIRPNPLGVRKLKVTARGKTLADAIIKEIIIEPEVQRETVENALLTVGTPRTFQLAAPDGVIAGSHRAILALTGSVLAQTIEGLENLLKMPYGCGEQNMLLFAPDVFIARYLKETGQNKPEIMAKAELLMITGYQRELTYRRTDGSYSAFGQSDKIGSLWLTAFVMKTFAQANGLIYIDDQVQTAARTWIGQQQKSDGSFDQVGFVHHQDMMGGVAGKNALTAYVAVALLEAGDTAAAANATAWLEGQLASITDPYALALTTYALGLAKSSRAAAARNGLLAIARESDEGLSWGDSPQPIPLGTPTPVPGQQVRPSPVVPGRGRSAAIETTGYAALALLAGGDNVNAGRAVRWLSARRGSQGGFGSTQDTVVALQALTASAATSRTDIDGTAWPDQRRIVLQGGRAATGQRRCDAVHRVARRGRLSDGRDARQGTAGGAGGQPLQPPGRRGRGTIGLPAGREVQHRSGGDERPDHPHGGRALHAADAGVGRDGGGGCGGADRFRPGDLFYRGVSEEDSKVEALGHRRAQGALLHRGDATERIDHPHLPSAGGALYPVRAQAVASQAYSYYRPEWRGEHLGAKVVVSGRV